MSTVKTNRTLRIALVRGDNIGDMVASLPMLYTLKQQLGAELHVFCRGYVAGVLTQVDYVAAVHELEAQTPESIAVLQLDVALFGNQNCSLSVEQVQRFVDAGVPMRIGQNQKMYGSQMTHALRRLAFTRYPQEIRRSFVLATPLGVAVPSMTEVARLHSHSLRQDDLLPWPELTVPYVVLHLYSNNHGREWPTGYFLQLAQALTAQGLLCVLTGSSAEGERVQQECPALLALPGVMATYGRLSLRELMQVLKHGQALISAGTGPLHLAAALGTPCVGIYPRYQGSNVRRWGAVGPRVVNLEGHGGCRRRPLAIYIRDRDCQKIGLTCPCVMNVSVQQVLDELQILMTTRPVEAL